MELLTLSLENFQGLKHEEIQLDGHSASIYGRNASGKTTIFNAITWLLFGKPSTWAKNWDPKTKGAQRGFAQPGTQRNRHLPAGRRPDCDLEKGFPRGMEAQAWQRRRGVLREYH